MKRTVGFLAFAAVALLTGASVWEGAAAVSVSDTLPEGGYYVATNSFPVNTVIDVTNLENDKTVRAVVASGLDTPGLLLSLSPGTAAALGLDASRVGRVRVSVPSDPVAFSRFTDGIALNSDPDMNPQAAIAMGADKIEEAIAASESGETSVAARSVEPAAETTSSAAGALPENVPEEPPASVETSAPLPAELAQAPEEPEETMEETVPTTDTAEPMGSVVADGEAVNITPAEESPSEGPLAEGSLAEGSLAEGSLAEGVAPEPTIEVASSAEADTADAVVDAGRSESVPTELDAATGSIAVAPMEHPQDLDSILSEPQATLSEETLPEEVAAELAEPVAPETPETPEVSGAESLADLSPALAEPPAVSPLGEALPTPEARIEAPAAEADVAEGGAAQPADDGAATDAGILPEPVPEPLVLSLAEPKPDMEVPADGTALTAPDSSVEATTAASLQDASIAALPQSEAPETTPSGPEAPEPSDAGSLAAAPAPEPQAAEQPEALAAIPNPETTELSMVPADERPPELPPEAPPAAVAEVAEAPVEVEVETGPETSLAAPAPAPESSEDVPLDIAAAPSVPEAPTVVEESRVVPESIAEVAAPAEPESATASAGTSPAPVAVAVPATRSPGTFSSPVLARLEIGKYYLQLGAFSSVESAQQLLAQVGTKLPTAVQYEDGGARPLYRVLVGPVNLGESGALVLRLKRAGYKDVFVRKGS